MSPKIGVPDALAGLKCADWQAAVVYLTRRQRGRAAGHRWDYDVFLKPERAEDRMSDERGREFQEPELWLKDDAGQWRKAAA